MGHLRSIRQCVITLGGQGTRLKKLSGDIPKPLLPISGKSTLERAVSELTSFGINDLIFLCGYQSTEFENILPYLREHYGCSIQLFVESSPMGEAGALFRLPFKLADDFLFLNGDIVFCMDYRRLEDFHFRLSSDITIVTHTSSHPNDSDCILEDSRSGIQAYKTKHEHKALSGCFLGNAGLAIISSRAVRLLQPFVDPLSRPDLFSGIVLLALRQGLVVKSYNTTEYLKDMGTPLRFSAVSKDIQDGITQRLSYVNKQRALFIDRDNTIIKCQDRAYITHHREVSLLYDNIEKIVTLSADFDFVICITNQPQVSMGKCTLEAVNMINGVVAESCLSQGLTLAAFYVCPHHTDAGHTGEIPQLKTNCFCRKPSPGLLIQAAYERNINISQSLFIGDTWRDHAAADAVRLSYSDINRL